MSEYPNVKTTEFFWTLRSITEDRKEKLERWTQNHPFLSAATSAPLRILSIMVVAGTRGQTEPEEVPLLREATVVANAIAYQGKRTRELIHERGLSFAIRRAVGFSVGGMTFGIPTVALLRETGSQIFQR